MPLDLEFARRQFPALRTENIAFFENAGGSYACRQVIERLHRFYTERKMQPIGQSNRQNLAVRKWTRRAGVFLRCLALRKMS